MPAVMNAADIVAAPSIWKEQYGRVVPEAMACGRALVVSDIGAMPELLGDCGVKIPCGNVEALSVALRRLLQDETERMRIGRRAALRARDELGIGTQADIVERTLAEFL
jgi:glycosyltransferase involved in cell wall biosynthesis